MNKLLLVLPFLMFGCSVPISETNKPNPKEDSIKVNHDKEVKNVLQW